MAGTVWDYHTRRMEITWELAQKLTGSSHRKDTWKQALQDAQQIVDEIISADPRE